jgi:hypothetical protein
MPELKFASICSNGHILDYKDSHENLVRQSGCQKCGKPLHTVCPNCENETVLIQRVEQEDGSYNLYLDDYCRACNAAFPWGPGKIEQFFHDKGITFDSSSSPPTPRETILTYPIRSSLSETKYGPEVIRQIKDGDKCYQNQLWHPALAMYIHGFEWSMIAYLQDNEEFDVIEKEREGTYFNFAGRSPNLLEVVTDYVTLDQKTIDRIEELNRSERRWMAHHKSGEVLRDEVESVRSRLGVLLNRLFDEENSNT